MTRFFSKLTHRKHAKTYPLKNASWRKLCLFAASIVFGLVSLVSAAEPTSSADYPKKINFRNIMQNEDIALGEVEAIIQDHEGFMWLGGRNALLRYDGYEFLTVNVAKNPKDPAQVTSVNQVIKLFEDSRHDLWVGTRSGLYKYDSARELLVPIQNAQGEQLFNEAAYAISESPTGELLVSSGYHGISVFNTKTFAITQIKHEDGDSQSLPSNAVSDLLVDEGYVWASTDVGVVRIDWATKSQTFFIPNPAKIDSTADNGIRNIDIDHHGHIWASSDNGIYRIDPVSGVILHYQNDPKNPTSLANNISRQIYVDKKGWVWIGSDGGGISLYDEPNDCFIRFSHQDGPGYLSSNSVRSFYEDNIGDFWIGTYPSGVNVYDHSTAAITVYKKERNLEQGLLDNNVEAIEEDKDGNLWIGAGGITRFNPKNNTFKHYQHTDGPDSKVTATTILNGLIDSDGEIRFGTWAHGITVYNAQKDIFEEIPVDSTQTKRGEKNGTKFNDRMVWSIYEDKQKDLWITTHSNGLTKFDKKTGIYTFYPPDANDPQAISTAVTWISFEDSKGRFWVGTANGLNLMDRDKGTFKQYLPKANDPRSLANGSVLSIYEDKKGRLWFGTDAGLHLYHPETDDFTVYDVKDGFANQGIRAITEDWKGNLWLGTNNGVVMFNPDSSTVRNYTRYNGELIGGIATGATLTTRTGDIVFGARSGLYIFNANKLVVNEKVPPVVLTDFRIFTQKIPIGGADNILVKTINQTEKVTLDYTKSMISFSFAALNYRDPDKNKYAYKLEGFDDDWREVANQRTALYTNLPAGNYKFRVKASNNDGVWNTQGHTIELTILPPPWKTWWAYCMYTLIGIGLLLFFVYTQHRQVLIERKTSRELEIKVAERTTELQTKNEELGEAYAQLEAISLSDPLTGLSNRRYLQKIMPMDIAKVYREYDPNFAKLSGKSASPDLTFFILDVDYFKSVNDVHGHTAGDHLLVQLSELLMKICRESDCVVRWGGEEFLIVSRFASREEAPLMAERIRKSIERHDFLLPDGSILKKTCSIGFACFPFLPEHPMELSWEQVIDVADNALYGAKKSGRNRSVGFAANANTHHKMLHQRISRNPEIMVNNEELTIISDKDDPLVWD
ncbi:MAG: diguanylate cyclase [Gammaproteobacteria bacterium]|nr:MAG: diguanylate cyclase [Gammaproteobacteria bacterium]